MYTTTFATRYCNGEIDSYTKSDKKYDIIVKGTMVDVVPSGEIRFIAASPCDRRASYTGSGLPFHSAEQAFLDSPNRGIIKVQGNYFEIPLLFPNSYQIRLGRELVPPTLFLMYDDIAGNVRVVRIKLGDPVPYRFLGYPSQFTLGRNDASFYHAHHNLPVRSQEQVLRDGAYPGKNKMSEDFWGLRPAL